MDATYKQSLCSSEFFCSLPSKLVCIISRAHIQSDLWFLQHLFSRHDLFTFKKFCVCVRRYIFSSWQFLGQPLERQWQIMVWNSARRRIYLRIDLSRCIYFLSTSVALNILSIYQLFHDFENLMSLFRRFRFWAPTRFPKVNCFRYDPGTIIMIWNF